MAIKWPSLYPRTQFWCKKFCMELEKVIKQIWLKYVEYLLRYWHFSPLPNLRHTRYNTIVVIVIVFLFVIVALRIP